MYVHTLIDWIILRKALIMPPLSLICLERSCQFFNMKSFVTKKVDRAAYLAVSYRLESIPGQLLTCLPQTCSK